MALSCGVIIVEHFGSYLFEPPRGGDAVLNAVDPVIGRVNYDRVFTELF